MRSRRSAARVGRHYLRMVPEERSIDTLLALIQQRLSDPDNLMKDTSVEQIRAEIARGVREDFACGRTSRVQGWVLARTEARLAALAALV